MKKVLFISLLAIVFCGGIVLAAEKLNSAANISARNGGPPTTTAKAVPKVKPVLNVACAKIAVERRDMAVISAFEKRATGVKSALSSRIINLKAAWDKATAWERNKARLEVWKKFRTQESVLRKDYKKDVKAAWDQYRKDKKTCYATEENSESEGTDNNL
ncbi:MAG: hypothetical protein WC459_02540 [Patescibacteria group bacterium]